MNAIGVMASGGAAFEFLLIPFVIALVAFSMFWRSSRSRLIVKDWAQKNGYQLVSSNYCVFWRGPFWFTSRGQTVYRVIVRDQQGTLRSGWVRCGSWFLGLLSTQTEVRWEN